jgi:hypothetical protein
LNGRLLDIIGLTFNGDAAIQKKTRLRIKQRVHKKVFLLKGNPFLALSCPISAIQSIAQVATLLQTLLSKR